MDTSEALAFVCDEWTLGRTYTELCPHNRSSTIRGIEYPARVPAWQVARRTCELWLARPLREIIQDRGQAARTGNARKAPAALWRDQTETRVGSQNSRFHAPAEEATGGGGPTRDGRPGVTALRRLPQPFSKVLQIDVREVHRSQRGFEVAEIRAVGTHRRR